MLLNVDSFYGTLGPGHLLLRCYGVVIFPHEKHSPDPSVSVPGASGYPVVSRRGLEPAYVFSHTMTHLWYSAR
jgi:hypothetical protein